MHRYGLTALVLFAAPNAHAENVPPVPPHWTVSLGGSTTMAEGQDSQPALNLSVVHVIGKGFIGLSTSVTDSSNNQVPAGLAPTRIEIATLSGGHQSGHFLLQAHAAAGRGLFQRGVLYVTHAQSIGVSSKADGFGLGISASRNIKLTDNLMLIPTLGIDYSATWVHRHPIDSEARQYLIESKSDGLTLSGGSALQARLGRSHQHQLTIMASAMRIGNTSDFIHRQGRAKPVDIKASVVDNLVDYGAALSLGLTRNLGIDLSASRSAGANGPQSTVINAGLHAMF